MQDLNDKITGNDLTASEWNELPSEIQNVIEGLGITLSGADLNQLGKGVAGYVANGNFYTDSGAADAYVLAKIGSKQTLPEYTDGMIVEFIPDNTNAGSSTVNVAGLGVKNIVDTANGGEISASVRIQLRYRSGSGDFEIIQILKTQASVSKAWVNFDGTGVVAIRDSFNVSSITDIGVGVYDINFTNNMPNINYSYSGSAGDAGVRSLWGHTPTSISIFRITTRDTSAVIADAEFVGISVFAN